MSSTWLGRAAAVLVLGLLAACGDGGEPADPDPTTTACPSPTSTDDHDQDRDRGDAPSCDESMTHAVP